MSAQLTSSDLDSYQLSSTGIEVEELDDVDVESAIYAAKYSQTETASTPVVPAGLETLASLDIFRDVDLASLSGLENNCQTMMLSPGQALIRAEQLNSRVYLVTEGQLRIVSGKKDKNIIGVIDAGKLLGLRSAIDQKPSSADFVAAEPSMVIAIDYQILYQYTKQSHALACNLLDQMTSCLQANNYVQIGASKVVKEKGNTDQTPAMDIDTLTGLHNGRWLRKMLPRQIARCAVDKVSLKLVVFRLDKMSAIETLYDAETKQRMIRAVAEVLLYNSRPNDLTVHEDELTFLAIRQDQSLAESETFIKRIKTVLSNISVEASTGETLPPPYLKAAVYEQTGQDPADTVIEKALTTLS
ncbi:MAG: cyclic nucleotide-binding domain-containing protein [Gammaproteobacteria bacterium]|nr:cyclic nucleotide-binding domain-containing protein [Gammaproteobacteria bacterium]